MEGAETLLENIERCHLPKLARNFDESVNHPEYQNRTNRMERNVKTVTDGIDKIDLKCSLVDDTEETVKAHRIAIISALLNLYYELQCSCSWNPPKARDGAIKINRSFKRNCEITLDDVLKENEVCDSQTVYDRVLDAVCTKLTVQDFKKYPGQIEVYCYFIQNYEEFDVQVISLKLFPVALILTDDYVEENIIKGLKCCQALLKNLTARDFTNGNYYDVIYLSIKNSLRHRNIKVTKMSQICALDLYKILPSSVKEEKLEEMYSDALEQLSTESNLYRKAAVFKYTKKLMPMLKIKCGNKSIFKTIIYNSIENCLTDGVDEFLLIPTLECLEEWIKHCWAVWKLSSDFKVLCVLLKYYSKCNSGEPVLYAQRVIVSLVSLCSKEEQKQFITKLTGNSDEVKSKMNALRRDIGV